MALSEHLKQIHAAALQDAASLQFDKTHALHFTLVALYGSIIELAHSMIVLNDAGSTCGIPSVFRTLLETRVEMVNLLNDPAYGYVMEAADLSETLKMLREARDEDNQYLADVASLPNLGELIADLERQLGELAAEGYKPLSIFDRFDRAGMRDEYKSVYNSLSTDAHSNRRALVDRHVELHEQDFELVFFKHAPDEYALPYLESAAAYLIDSTREILTRLGSPAALKHFEGLLYSIPDLQQESRGPQA